MRPRWLLVLLLAVVGTLIVTAMRRTSATFDEIVIIAAGARGYQTGAWNLAPEHPPLVQYLYGLPVAALRPTLPSEAGVADSTRALMNYRYDYAREFFWKVGNDPERLAFAGRLPAVLCALGIVLLVYGFVSRYYGPLPGLAAAAMTAFLPDLLAHGGIAYNDVPLALVFLAAVWALDSAMRQPEWRRAALAGALCGLALGVKTSAIALLPIAAVLFVMEAVRRTRDGGWWLQVVRGAGVALLAAYLTLVLVYRGDFSLAEYRGALEFVFGQVTTRVSPAFLLGERGVRGWWYYFPVAFLFKTSAMLHLLAAIAALSLLLLAVREPRRVLQSRLRAPAIALIVFGGLLLTARLNIGFRHALPALPPLVILTAVGLARLWPSMRQAARVAMVAAGVWLVAQPVLVYPWFISYMSEYAPPPADRYRVLADSNLDWGHGLLALRDWMRDNDVPSVYLSYFGSAYPEGYGIDYVPLVSFLRLDSRPIPDPEPLWTAISATNMTGVYLSRDAFAPFRGAQPDVLLAGSILLYRMDRR